MSKNDLKIDSKLMVRFGDGDEELIDFLQDKRNRSGELKKQAKRGIKGGKALSDLKNEITSLKSKVSDLKNKNRETVLAVDNLVNEKNDLIEEKNKLVEEKNILTNERLAMQTQLADEQKKVGYLENRTWFDRLRNAKNYDKLLAEHNSQKSSEG